MFGVKRFCHFSITEVKIVNVSKKIKVTINSADNLRNFIFSKGDFGGARTPDSPHGNFNIGNICRMFIQYTLAINPAELLK